MGIKRARSMWAKCEEREREREDAPCPHALLALDSPFHFLFLALECKVKGFFVSG